MDVRVTCEAEYSICSTSVAPVMDTTKTEFRLSHCLLRGPARLRCWIPLFQKRILPSTSSKANTASPKHPACLKSRTLTATVLWKPTTSGKCPRFCLSLLHTALAPFTDTRASKLSRRGPIFGNQPPPPKQGKHYYSSRERYYGYRISTHFGMGDGDSSPTQTAAGIGRVPNGASIVAQMKGSLAAMHTLYEFADKYLEGGINLPQWATASPRRTKERGQVGRDENGSIGYGSRAGQQSKDSSSEKRPPNAAANANKAPSTLIQMPKKRTRR